MSDAKSAILARRAKFVAAAVASLSISCGKEKARENEHPPGPCLSIAYLPDAAATNVDAGAHAVDAGVDAGRAHPCLCVCQPGDPLCSCL